MTEKLNKNALSIVPEIWNRKMHIFFWVSYWPILWRQKAVYTDSCQLRWHNGRPIGSVFSCRAKDCGMSWTTSHHKSAVHGWSVSQLRPQHYYLWTFFKDINSLRVLVGGFLVTFYLLTYSDSGSCQWLVLTPVLLRDVVWMSDAVCLSVCLMWVWFRASWRQ